MYKEWELTFKQYRFFDSDAFVDIEFPCDIDTFYDAFNIHCKKMTRALEIKWRHGFMELMLDRAVDAFHFFEQNEKVYEKSRTKKLLRSLNLRMSSMLRYLLEESIADMNAYLKKNELDSTKEIYARDCLVIEDERHLKNAPGRNFGAFIANDKNLCYFLGEGDDASHLKWNTNNPRLAENFVGYQMSLAMVRTSLPALAKTISTLDQELYEDLFNDLMSVPVPVKKGANKKKKKRPKRIPVVPRVKKLEDFTIENVDKSTIKISNSATFSLSSSTKKVQIKFAYENFASKGDPFKLYHRFDFDLANFTKKDFVLKNCSIITYDANILELDIENQNFEISIKGFDAHDCRVEINDV